MVTKIIKLSSEDNQIVEEFLKRPAFDDFAEETAREVLHDIADNGIDAVLSCIERFDGVKLSADQLRVSDDEIEAALPQVDDRFKSAVADTKSRIKAFCETGMKKDWDMPTDNGGRLGEKFVPFDRVGVYIPGGAAPLVSTALMTAYIASIAGVKEIVACTPMGKDGLNPLMLYGLKEAGVTEIYKAGGIQAIGLMAYGIDGVNKVQKIVGPGGTFVTAAKRQVYGDVALDLVAGPSEIAILADADANPAFAAADLLSQAEHGSGFEKSLLVTDSMEFAKAVDAEIEKQTEELSRKELINKVVAGGGILLVVTDNLDAGMDLCNRFAPEHFEIMVESAEKWLAKVTCAGAVFLGEWTPESVGDFAAGPSHVLPTGGAAAMFSGLTVDDFRRRTSFMKYTMDDLKDVLPTVTAFSEVEGLDGHGKSAKIRFAE